VTDTDEKKQWYRKLPSNTKWIRASKACQMKSTRRAPGVVGARVETESVSKA